MSEHQVFVDHVSIDSGQNYPIERVDISGLAYIGNGCICVPDITAAVLPMLEKMYPGIPWCEMQFTCRITTIYNTSVRRIDFDPATEPEPLEEKFSLNSKQKMASTPNGTMTYPLPKKRRNSHV